MEAHKETRPDEKGQQIPVNNLKDTLHEGLFLSLQIENRNITALLDTGSNITILKKTIYDDWQENKPKIQPTRDILVGITGDRAKFYGKIELEFTIGEQMFQYPVFLADIANDFIIGRDFMMSNSCDIILSRQILKINGKEIYCHTNEFDVQCCRVALTTDIEIPPDSEIVITGRTMDSYDNTKLGVTTPNNNLFEKHNVLLARALVKPSNGLIPIQIANFDSVPKTLHKDTIVANMEMISENSLKEFEEHHVNCTTTEPSKNTSFKQTPEVPEHMKELIESTIQNLSEIEGKKAKALLLEYEDVFCKSDDDMGHTDLVEFTINTGDHAPVRTPPYRLPAVKREQAEKEIQKLLEKDLIEPAQSPWLSPVVVVPKPDKTSVRLCIDFRKVNTRIKFDAHPLPRIDQSLESLSGNKYFSSMDCRSAYHQISIKEEDRPVTAFSIGGETYIWKVMPFGMSTSPAVFERLIEKIMQGLTYKACLIYLDDLLCYSKTFEQHIDNLREMFTRLRSANLKLCPKKCKLFQRRLSFLGHQLSEDGIEACTEKTEKVKNWPRPQNVRQLRSFLGLCSYYRKMVQNFATIAKPLHSLTETNTPFTWDDKAEAAFRELKDRLCNAPILAFPIETQPFILDTDASNVAAGAVLSQVQNNQERVISYYSQCFTHTERNYCTTRKELYAIVLAVKHFHHFLYGNPFTIRSDHGSLQWILNFKNCEGQLARWLETLGNYQFTIEYRAGRIHNNCDALSRRPCADKHCPHCERAETKYSTNEGTEHTVRTGNLSAEEPSTSTNSDSHGQEENFEPSRITAEQASDPILKKVLEWLQLGKRPEWQEISKQGMELKHYWHNFDLLELDNNMMYQKVVTDDRSLKRLILLPQCMRHSVFKQLHAKITAGHLGFKKTYHKIQNRFHWYGMCRDVERYCLQCDTCAMKKQPQRKAKGPLQLYQVGQVLERIAIDIQGPYPTSRRGKRYILVVCDYFSKWMQAIPLKSMEAKYVAKKLIDKFIGIFGTPLELFSDRGTNFESEVFKEMCSLLGIHKTRTTVGRPSSDGLVERMNRVIQNMLTAFVQKDQKDWCEHLPLLVLAYNASTHSSTGFTPSMMMFGREMNLPIDLAIGKPVDEKSHMTTTYVLELENIMTEIHETAREKLGQNAISMKTNYDKGKFHTNYEVGSPVWYYNAKRQKGLNPKLQNAWTGPYTITKKWGDVLYSIQLKPNSRPLIVHHDKLKVYRGPDSPDWYRNQE